MDGLVIGLLALVLVAAVGRANVDQIDVAKCCDSGEVYSFVGGRCVEGEAVGASWPPPIYATSGVDLVNVSQSGFQDFVGTVECGNGTIASSSRNFKLFDNNTLETESGDRHSAQQFCVERALADEDPAAKDFIARFCVPDPCETQECIRKCCPLGSPVDGEPVMRAGIMPTCDFFDLIDPEKNPEDIFYVLPSGQLYIPKYDEKDRVIDNYCTDNFLDGDQLSIKGIICLPEIMIPPDDSEPVGKVFSYLQIISTIFLIATFAVYASLPPLRNIHGVTVMSLSVSLAVTYLCLAIGNQHRTINPTSCQTLIVLLHFFFLASFTWLSVMSFDIWWTFSDLRPRTAISNGRHRIGKRFIYYSLFAWGLPLVIVVIGQILNNMPDLPANIIKPGFNPTRCWFSPDETLPIFVYFYGPIAVMLACNVIFFSLTAVQLHRASMDSAFATNNHRAKQRMRVIFSLFILMGISWIMEIVSWLVGGSALYWIPSDVFNILMGVFIFIIFVCKKKVRKLLAQKFLGSGWKTTVGWRQDQESTSKPRYRDLPEAGRKLSNTSVTYITSRDTATATDVEQRAE